MRMPSLPSPQSCALTVLVTLVACGPSSPIVDAGGETTGEQTSDDSGGSSGTTTSTSDEPEPEPGTDQSTGDPSNGFINDPDEGGAAFQCDVWTQNCPAGEKCTFWANDGGGSWNATRCVEIDPEADEIGEPCTVEDSGTSGIDTCVFAAMCWNVDPETFEGTCVGLCGGDESDPFCEDPSMICVGRGPFLCLPTCCPLEQDCPQGQACYPFDNDFECAPDASGDMGGFGDPCEFINVCNPGLLCMGASAIPDCTGAFGCCTPFCEVGSTSCSLLHPELECVPWYEEGSASPGAEHVGACTVMQ
jgi:hypothetical protein